MLTLSKNTTLFGDISLSCNDCKVQNDEEFWSVFMQHVSCNLALCVWIADSNCAWVLEKNFDTCLFSSWLYCFFPASLKNQAVQRCDF